MYRASAAFPLLFLFGCAHSVITPFQTPAHSLQPLEPREVGIYRSTNPYSSFEELGLISYHTDSDNWAAFYEQIRKDAAAYGANAVVDVKMSAETHTETYWENHCVPVTTCNADGSCSTVQQCISEPVSRDVTTHMMTGSMIRGKK